MEDDSSLSREQLIEKIKELKRLNKQLLEENEQETRLDFSWSGNLGHWYWDIPANTVTFNPLKITNLGYSREEIPERVSYHYFTEKLHPDDFDKTMDAMKDHLSGKTDVYEVEYRIQAKDGSYKWYSDRGRITQYGENGKPAFLAGIVFDISESKELQLQLENENRILAEQSNVDVLTKVKNRRALMTRLEEETEEAQKSMLPLSIAMFDIDNFKKLNDSYGHLYGDRVLFEVASIMQKSIREEDVIGRYGGEEFMVLFRNTGIEKARSISERIREAIAANSFKGNVLVTVSGGVSQYQGAAVQDLIHDADMNLYAAKRNGKNQIK